MPLPIDIVLVRHGESEGNVANRHSRMNDDSLFTDEHASRHSSEWRLTDKGIEQAKAAGQYIKKNIFSYFDCYATSSYVRTRETAAYLNLDKAKWSIEPYLMERSQGDMEKLTHKEQIQKFSQELRKRALEEFYWKPPNGESYAEVSLRYDRVLTSLSDRYPDGRIIVVAHQTLIEAAMIRRLHWTPEEFCKWKEDDEELTKIHNCQVIHLSRRDPETGKVLPKIRWYRSVCPWDMSKSINEWQRISDDYTRSNEDLLNEVEKFPRIITG